MQLAIWLSLQPDYIRHRACAIFLIIMGVLASIEAIMISRWHK